MTAKDKEKTTRRKSTARKTKKVKHKKPSKPKVRVREHLTQEFVDEMKENMWQFMNHDTIMFVLEFAGCHGIKRTFKDDIEDDDFDESFRQSICFKGDEKEGHYVYIDRNLQVWGTYENEMIEEADDGVCHGAAIAAASNDCDESTLGYFPLHRKPKHKQRVENYNTIMSVYKKIINNGSWDKALEKYFYNDVEFKPGNTKSEQTLRALELLEKFKAVEYLK